MTIAFTYRIYTTVGRTYLGDLPAKNVAWVESVNGATTWTGKVVIPAGDTVRSAQLDGLTALDNTLYVYTPDRQVPWAGYISSRSWDPDTNELSVEATEWRSWLYRIIAGPKSNYTVQNYGWDQVDQLRIAREVAQDFLYAEQVIGGGQEGGHGLPWIVFGTEMSGVLRDLNARGTLFRSIGTWIDSMANRDNGFEWDLVGAYTSGGLPVLNFTTYYPQRGNSVEGLIFKYGTGGNILKYEPVKESNAEIARRVWTIGTGPDSDDLPFAQDTQPELIDDAAYEAVRFDSYTNYQDVTEQATLESYARAEREFFSVPLTLFTFTVSMQKPYVYGYGKGDRCNVFVEDRWLSIDAENVRIVERTISPDTNLAKITVDLSDLELPDIDTDPEI